MHPIIKKIRLNVDILICDLGTSRDVGPIITEYIEPIIRPIIKYIVCDLKFLSKCLTALTVSTIQRTTPHPKVITPGKYFKFSFKISFMPLSIGA